MRVKAALVGAAVSLYCMGAAVAAPATDPKAVKAGEYTLDKQHASLTAKIGHLGFSNFTLRFNGIDASFTYDPARPEASVVKATIDPATVDTGDSKFNAEIAGEKILNAPKFPQITFQSTSLKLDSATRGKLAGNLTFFGNTRPVVLDVTFNGVGTGMKGEDRIGFSATGSINRLEYGFEFLKAGLSDKVDLLIEAEFLKR
jgi:polyisoprenoid-binding protein YceI